MTTMSLAQRINRWLDERAVDRLLGCNRRDLGRASLLPGDLVAVAGRYATWRGRVVGPAYNPEYVRVQLTYTPNGTHGNGQVYTVQRAKVKPCSY